MDLLSLLKNINNFIALPSIFIFLAAGIILTLKTCFIQFRAFPYFLKLFSKTKSSNVKKDKKSIKTINSVHAMFASMATTLGMGNIVGPSVAIVAGGPGALFWLVFFAFFGGVIKYTEVTFALHTREKTSDGKIMGGPTQYLKLVHQMFSHWYGFIMIGVFAVWSGIQSNILSDILAKEGVMPWQTGLFLAGIVLVVLHGGAKRVGFLSSRLVPIMCFFYVSFALLIIFKDITLLTKSLKLVFSSAFTSTAAFGGFAGATLFQAMSAGIYKSVYITEAGLGTSSIAHAVADVKKPTDQGVLAMYSIVADAFFSFLSGLLVLVTGVWMTVNSIDNTLMYEVFKMNSPVLGRFVLIISIALFVITTVIGNSFNGSQNFSSLTRHRFKKLYHLFTAGMIFWGAIVEAPLVWELVGTLIVLVAMPNIFGLLYLAFSQSKVLELK